MKKHLLTLALAFCLVLGLGVPATAVESDGISVIVNDAVIELDVPVQVFDQVTYVSYFPVVRALYPDAAAVWENDQAVVTAPGLTMTIQPGRDYMVANGRYLYLPQGVKISGNVILVPARTLAAALGANVAWDPTGNAVVITAGSGPITSGDLAYQSDVVYWLSHIINAESGNQPLAGKIAVGNVVLNRVKSPDFPDTIYGVIFDDRWGGQFEPVRNGTVYDEPTAESVEAARLCLEGVNTAGDSLYFLAPHLTDNHWTMENRTYVTTIGCHWFYQ